PMFAAAVKRLNVGTGRRFSNVTQESLVADLSAILTPERGGRAREIAARMSKPADSIAATADALEDAARLRRFG
ncbi:glycosyltransferase, partial [Mycobacterium kansasii]